jgi:enoyl-CoA hydratase/carnithine racemase
MSDAGVASEAAVLVDDLDGVRRVTFNRPAVHNALSSRCYQLLTAALNEAAEDDAIACVLVTGNGRTFTAGLDLLDEEFEPDERWRIYDAFIRRLESFPKPLVAAVNGAAVGIGTTMLGHCDLVLAGESARFRLPFVALGLAPEGGSTLTLPVTMGPQATARAMFTAAWMSATEAEAAGLVWKVVGDDELLAATASECEAMASMPVESLVVTKRLLLRNRLEPARTARTREEAEFRRLQDGPAHAEALAAFRERRPPVFRPSAS